jgi:hypothetical protein
MNTPLHTPAIEIRHGGIFAQSARAPERRHYHEYRQQRKLSVGVRWTRSDMLSVPLAVLPPF